MPSPSSHIVTRGSQGQRGGPTATPDVMQGDGWGSKMTTGCALRSFSALVGLGRKPNEDGRCVTFGQRPDCLRRAEGVGLVLNSTFLSAAAAATGVAGDLLLHLWVFKAFLEMVYARDLMGRFVGVL